MSTREIEVFNLLAKGRGSVYIQEKLYISQHTVKTHTYHIYKKLGVNSREELLTLIEQTTIANPPAVADGNSERAKERCD